MNQDRNAGLRVKSGILRSISMLSYKSTTDFEVIIYDIYQNLYIKLIKYMKNQLNIVNQRE